MEQITIDLSYINASIASVIVICATFWKADDLILSDSGAKVIYKSIKSTASDPDNSEISKIINEFIDGYFSAGNGYGRFFLNVMLLTLSSLVIMLSLYTAKTVGTFNLLFTRGFLSQFFGNGFVVTYLVNFFVFLSYPLVIRKVTMAHTRKSLYVLFLDIFIKVALFMLLTAVTYMFFADFYGSFSGSKLLALQSIPATLHLAIQFKNLTSVYLYSILLSSFPIFVVALINIMRTSEKLSTFIRQTLFWLPFEAKPIRAVSMVFALFVGLFLLVLVAVLSLIDSI